MNSFLRNSGRIPQSCLHLSHLLLATLLFFSGCAQKPWGDPFGEEENLFFIQLFEDIRQKEAECGICMDGDINLFLKSRIGKRAGAGYFQIMQPEHVKFIASNPFGQPLLLFTSDGSTFQYINTTERLSMAGDVNAFFQTLDAPSALVSSSWGAWLTGRLPQGGVVKATRKDGGDRGVWVTVASEGGEGTHEHLLIDIEKRKLLSRVVTEKEQVLLQINYQSSNRSGTDSSCTQPHTLDISGLEYGAELTLKISKPGEFSGCSPADFALRVPPAYMHREM